MKILCIDTSTSLGSLALFEGHQLLAEKQWEKQKSHSEIVTLALHELLQEQGLSIKEVGGVSVGIGPGSFTGIRVSVNLARTLSYSLDLPITAHNSLKLIAANGFSKCDLPIAVMTNAFRNQVYLALYESRSGVWVEVESPQSISFDQLANVISKPHLCLGDGFDVYQSVFADKLKSSLVRDFSCSDFPLAAEWGKLAAKNFSAETKVSWQDLAPLYVRASSAEEKLKL